MADGTGTLGSGVDDFVVRYFGAFRNLVDRNLKGERQHELLFGHKITADNALYHHTNGKQGVPIAEPATFLYLPSGAGATLKDLSAGGNDLTLNLDYSYVPRAV